MPRSPSSLGRFLGGLTAFLAPGAAMLGVAVTVGSNGGETITPGEWITACVAALVASVAVDGTYARHREQIDPRPPYVPPDDLDDLD